MTPKKAINSDDGPTITAKELKQLRRVFDDLCFFADKAPKKERLKEIHHELTEIRRPGDGYSTRTQQDTSVLVAKLEAEQKHLKDEVKKIESAPEQYIRAQDTGIAMKSLGKRMTKREIYEIMWEVDEKVDGVVDWEEFSLMFERNVRDTSGLEPANFYHMVQFMIYDGDGNGKVSIDETMNMLYARLGRIKMETTITKLFGGEDGAPIVEVGEQGGEIDFEHYWAISENEQLKMFDASARGQNMKAACKR
jgi:Ca2+-binding EF-hand superfamily protein